MKQTIATGSRLLRRHGLAVLALFVALGGSSYAAAAHLMPKNSVGSAQVIDGSLLKRDLGEKALTALKGARGPQGLRGVAGPAGIRGVQGPKGNTGAAGARGQAGAQGPLGVTGVAMNRSTPAAATLTTLDSPGDVGFTTSSAIGADGLGLISSHDETNGDLRVAHCNDTACASATKTTLDSAGDVGKLGTSVAIGADGLGLISYYDVTNGTLKVAHCDNTACMSATKTTLDGGNPNVGVNSSVTIGSDGLGLISYADTTTADLRVAHCDNVPCTSASVHTLDSSGFVGYNSSITTGADGRGLISYYDGTNYPSSTALKVAHCDDLACTSATTSTLDSNGLVADKTSVTTGADGLGLISYHDQTNNDLNVAHCDNSPCTSATLSTVDSALVSGELSVTIGTDGLGLISYFEGSNGGDLKVAHCNNVFCAGASTSSVDSNPGVAGNYSSVTIGTDGLPLIGYQGLGDLKVAHCANTLCVPYLRRR